ncbi:hypothetical protein E2320_022608 [Naja naja]|nr:hypothetical protein E2320_022608 [Naja naja]
MVTWRPFKSSSSPRHWAGVTQSPYASMTWLCGEQEFPTVILLGDLWCNRQQLHPGLREFENSLQSQSKCFFSGIFLFPSAFPREKEGKEGTALKFEVSLRKDSVVGFSSFFTLSEWHLFRASSSTSCVRPSPCEGNTKQNAYLKNIKEQTCGCC